MRDFGKVAPTFWTRGTGLSIRGNHVTQLVALYLMSAPGANMIGLYYLPAQTIAHDVGCPFEGAWEGLRSLSEGAFCRYDGASETVFVRTMARRQLNLDDGEQLSANDKRQIAVVKLMRECGSALLLQAFWEEYRTALRLPAPWWNKPLPRGFEGASKGLGRGIAQEQEQEQEQETGGASAAPPGDPGGAPPASGGASLPDSRHGSVESQEMPKRQRTPKQQALPSSTTKLNVAAGWKVWREMYRLSRRQYGKYVENGACGKAMATVARRAHEEAQTQHAASGGDLEALELAVLRHWFKRYLQDDGKGGFLADRRHALQYLVGSLTEYGLPWNTAVDSADARAEYERARAGLFVPSGGSK